MASPVLYVTITNHGFGHVTRTTALVAEIQRQLPEVVVILGTSAPRWLLDSCMAGEFIHRPRSLDVGVVQSDSLTLDQAATLEKLRLIQSQQKMLVASEVHFIQQNRVSLVLADIPPLAAVIARTAGVPCWMSSNFGWDLIYREWGGEFTAIADWIGECFSQCDRLFRLPFHEPMPTFPLKQDVGLTGAIPRHTQAEITAAFQLKIPPERTVLLTFGGLGLHQIPYANLQKFPDWQFITFDRNAPEDWPNLLKIKDQKYRPVDLMPCCGRVISKPGYGTFSEACRLGVPIISLDRADFAEARFLLQGLQDYSQHRILQPADFFETDWEFLHQPLLPPRQSLPLAQDGNQAIATAVIDYLQTQCCAP